MKRRIDSLYTTHNTHSNKIYFRNTANKRKASSQLNNVNKKYLPSHTAIYTQEDMVAKNTEIIEKDIKIQQLEKQLTLSQQYINNLLMTLQEQQDLLNMNSVNLQNDITNIYVK